MENRVGKEEDEWGVGGGGGGVGCGGFFFFNDTATTEIYTLSLHDALPIYFDHPFMTRENLGLWCDIGDRRFQRRELAFVADCDDLRLKLPYLLSQ